jgi:hypothetical protein
MRDFGVISNKFNARRPRTYVRDLSSINLIYFNLILRSPKRAQPVKKPISLPKYTNTHVKYNYTPQNKNRRGKCEYCPTPI